MWYRGELLLEAGQVARTTCLDESSALVRYEDPDYLPSSVYQPLRRLLPVSIRHTVQPPSHGAEMKMMTVHPAFGLLVAIWDCTKRSSDSHISTGLEGTLFAATCPGILQTVRYSSETQVNSALRCLSLFFYQPCNKSYDVHSVQVGPWSSSPASSTP